MLIPLSLSCAPACVEAVRKPLAEWMEIADTMLDSGLKEVYELEEDVSILTRSGHPTAYAA